ETILPVTLPSTRSMSLKRISPLISVPSARNPEMSSCPIGSRMVFSLPNGITNPPFISSPPCSVAAHEGGEQPVELLVGVELDLDLSPPAAAHDAHLGPETMLQLLLGRAAVRVFRLRRRPGRTAGFLRDVLRLQTRDQHLGLAHRQEALHHLVGDPNLCRGVGDCHDRLGMPGGQTAVLQ